MTLTFLIGCIGIFNLTSPNNKFYLAKSINDKDGSIQITILSGAYEIEKLNNEIERIIFKKDI